MWFSVQSEPPYSLGPSYIQTIQLSSTQSLFLPFPLVSLMLLCLYLLIPGLISSEGLWYVPPPAVFSSSLLPLVSFPLRSFGAAALLLALAAFALPGLAERRGNKRPQTAACVHWASRPRTGMA